MKWSLGRHPPMTKSLGGAGNDTPSIKLVRLIADGLSMKEIADQMGKSLKTAEYHWARAKRHYGFRNYVDATRWAIKNGLVSLDEKGVSLRL